LSFFDEADEPRTEPRTAPSTRRPSGTGRRPPSDQQTIRLRQAAAAVAILIVVILIVLGVHSCQVSAATGALKDYANAVSALNQQSDQTSKELFTQLSGAGTASNVASLQTQLNGTLVHADSDLSRGKGLSAPDQVKAAQQNLVLAMQMRRDGISTIAGAVQQALGTSTSRDALGSIATEMARFYASDVLYKDYVIPSIVGALHGAGIAVGGTNGETIDAGQFLPDLGWLTPTFIAAKLGAQAPAASGKPAPGVHGHTLDSVTVAGTMLQTGSPNTIPASPPPTFTLHFTNGGTVNETNVVLAVTVKGTSISGQTVVPQTTAGAQSTGQVTLSSSPPAGTFNVTATVKPILGEKQTQNNSQTFPVTFQ
jgi:hypothetical protein